MKFSTRIYIHPSASRPFYHERDARGWCQDNSQDPTYIMAFDSIAEWERWEELKQMQRDGIISDLHRQVKYELVPEQYEMLKVGEKTVKTYVVDNIAFPSKGAAVIHCRKHGIKSKEIVCYTHSEPKMKKILLERPITYTADFVYKDSDGNEIVEDCKSDYTRREKDYILRRKLMLWYKKIKIYEYIAPPKRKRK